MRALASYGAAAALFLVLAGLAVPSLVPAAEPAAVWVAAGITWPVQLLAFWALLKGRVGSGFMVAWALGMALRFTVVALVAVWLSLTPAYDITTALVSLVGFVFVLVLLEPLFLRLAD